MLYVSACSVIINSPDGGYITSPGYPNNYQNDMMCTITVDPKGQIHIDVQFFYKKSTPINMISSYLQKIRL